MDRVRLSRAAVELGYSAAAGVPVMDDALDVLDRYVGADVLVGSTFGTSGVGPMSATVRGCEPPGAADVQEWRRLMSTHPYLRWLADEPPGTSRLTDVVELEAFRRTEVYESLLAPRGQTYQACLVLDRRGDALTSVSLWRPDHDFTPAEVEALDVVRGLLVAGLAYREALGRARAFGGPISDVELSPRQREVISLVARGLTNDQVARRLDISSRTVRKHLEQAFAATGCRSRTAVAMWWRQGGRRAT